MEDIFAKLTNVSNPFTYEATNVDSLFKFLQTIDWSERWLTGIIVFHALTTVFILLTKRCSNVQVLTFLSLLGLCYFSEALNELGAKHWRSFAMEQYFDANGVFICIVFSAPIMLNTCLIVMLWLYECFAILKDIIKMRKKRAMQNKQSSNEGNNDISKTVQKTQSDDKNAKKEN